MPDVNQFLATVILVSFVVTVVLAVASYIGYKLRERRAGLHPPASPAGPVFFERVAPPPPPGAEPGSPPA